TTRGPGSRGPRVFVDRRMNRDIFSLPTGPGVVILSLHFRLLFSPAGGRHMLTDYMVTCPHVGCHWSGSLLPSRNREAWLSAIPKPGTTVLECPRCQGEWFAEVVGDDARPLPLATEELVRQGA